MKKIYPVGIFVALASAAVGISFADVVINENTPPAQAVQPHNTGDADTSTTSAVPLSSVPAGTVVVLQPGQAAPQLDREGDYYVVAGLADLDRYHTLLRVKDDKQGWVTLAFRDGVEIYRHGKRIDYMDVNNGDNVTVRFKA